MQRLILLMLAISLGVLIFVCSREGIQQPIHDSDLNRVSIKEIDPFYYVAFPHQGAYEDQETAIEQFIEELGKQEVPLTDYFLFLYFNDPTAVPVTQLDWSIAIPVTDSMLVEFPLVLSKWNFNKVLSVNSEKVYTGSNYSELLFRKYASQKGLQPDSPMVEIVYQQGASIGPTREHWCPITQ